MMGNGKESGKLRVGVFGNLGMLNIGNDASLDALLVYLRREFPGASIDAMCRGPEVISSRFGIPAIPICWREYSADTPRVFDLLSRVLSKGIDVVRTAAWVRRHDVIMVPGMGSLETSLPVRAWGFPYELFLVSIAGRLFGVKVALVCVGATKIRQRAIGWLFNNAARFAHYRSYRDPRSKEVMRQRGIDTTRDRAYTDLVFSFPVPAEEPVDRRSVCVGVMDYHGTNDDRKVATEIRTAYIAEMVRFVEWLLDNDRTVRLIIGDANGSDGAVVQEIMTRVRAARPELESSRLTAPPIDAFADIVEAMRTANSVVAIRYHNIVASLLLGKPTIALAYALKQEALMGEFGLEEFCFPARFFDHAQLIDRFTQLEAQAPAIRQTVLSHRKVTTELLEEQFAELSEMIAPSALR
jgi:polysaccharide pyruvyl transferase WcaK-like protein